MGAAGRPVAPTGTRRVRDTAAWRGTRDQRLCQIGRVAVTVGALPAIYTVSFVLEDEHLLFRVAQCSVLRRAVNGSVVAFSADHFDEDDEDGWTVMVRGIGEEVRDEALAVSLRSLPLRSYSEAPERDCFVKVSLTQMSGARSHWPHVGGAASTDPANADAEGTDADLGSRRRLLV